MNEAEAERIEAEVVEVSSLHFLCAVSKAKESTTP